MCGGKNRGSGAAGAGGEQGSEEVRGKSYMLGLEEVSRRVAEAWDRGAGEVCMQGGIHPDFTGDTYLRRGPAHPRRTSTLPAILRSRGAHRRS